MRTLMRLILIVGLLAATFTAAPGTARAGDEESTASLPATLQKTFLASASKPFGRTTVGYSTTGDGLAFALDDAGMLSIRGDDLSWSIRLVGFGRGTELLDVSAPETVQTDGRLEYRRPELTEWYRDTILGVQQGFTISSAPAGKGILVLRLDLTTDLTGVPDKDGRGLSFTISDEETLRYDSLRAWDANGTALEARMAYLPGQILIQVNERGAAYPITIDPFWYKSQRVTPATNPKDVFGIAVAISGNTAVIGAQATNVAGSIGPGAAYVFVRSGTSWIQQAKLVPSDGKDNDMFGQSVAISGDVILVGAPHHTVGMVWQGAAYIFVRNGTTWTQQAKLFASNGLATSKFGSSVAVSGDLAVVGSPLDDKGTLLDAGSIYVYRRDGNSWTFIQKEYAFPSKAEDRFGTSVAIHGTTMVVGAPYHDIGFFTKGGAAYTFFWDELDGLWQQFPDPILLPGTEDGEFGSSVAISGGTILVGAPRVDAAEDTADRGAAYVFVPSDLVGVWVLQQKVLAPDGASGDLFGNAVAIHGATLAVGARLNTIGANINQGSAYMFMRVGSAWNMVNQIISLQTTAGDQFGSSVAVSGDTVLIGAPFNDLLNSDAGAAFFLCAKRSDTDLEVSAAVNPSSPFSKNQMITLSTTVSNLGPASADYVMLSVSLPAGFEYSSSTVSQGSYEFATGSWSVGTLAPAASATLDITAKVTSAPGKTVYFTPMILAQDTNNTNNQASLPLKVYKTISLNGSFEVYGGSSLIPTNWQASLFTGTNGKDTSVFQHGAASVRIASMTAVTKTLTQTLTLAGASGDNFSFSFHVRGNALPAAGVCKGEVLLYNGTTLVTTKVLNCPTGTFAFQKLTSNFTAPGAFTKIIIRLTHAKAGGTVWFDNLQLNKAP